MKDKEEKVGAWDLKSSSEAMLDELFKKKGEPFKITEQEAKNLLLDMPPGWEYELDFEERTLKVFRLGAVMRF